MIKKRKGSNTHHKGDDGMLEVDDLCDVSMDIRCHGMKVRERTTGYEFVWLVIPNRGVGYWMRTNHLEEIENWG